MNDCSSVQESASFLQKKKRGENFFVLYLTKNYSQTHFYRAKIKFFVISEKTSSKLPRNHLTSVLVCDIIITRQQGETPLTRELSVDNRQEEDRHMEKKATHLYRPEELEAVHVTMEEAETTISISRGENTATIWTSDNTVLTKLKKVMKAAPKDCVLKEVGWYKGEPVSYKFEVKKKMVRIGAPRVLTDEQREAMSERAKAMQARKNA